METKKFNYEAPEAVVFGVETQNCFASCRVSNMTVEDVNAWDDEATN